MSDLERKHKKVTFAKLNMSTLGLICRGVDGNGKVQELMSIGLSEFLTIRTTYYIFCRKDTDWTNPQLITL